ncbi:MAG: glutamate ABC transporter substrate-binding protein [Pseudonocardiaceae bacterium]
MRIRDTLRCAGLGTVLLVATAGCGSSDHPVTVAAAPPPAAPPPATPPPAAVERPTVAPEPEPAVSGCVHSLRPPSTLPEPGRMPTGSTMAHIQQRGHLVAGVDQDTYLTAFRDENLRLQGFDIDVVRDIAEAIFGNRDAVVFKPLDVANRLNPVETGEVDLVVATVSITCQRETQVAFSAPYLNTGQRVLVDRDSTVTGLSDLGGKRVCAARGSTSLTEILADPAHPVAVGVPTATDCLVKLQLGEVVAVSTDDVLLAGMAAQDPRTKIVGPKLTVEPYGVAINRNASDLVRFVNGVLARRVQHHQWLRSYQLWLAPKLDDHSPPPAPPTPDYQD